MQLWLPGLIVGILLVVSALLMLWSHVRTWQSRRADPEIEKADRSFWYRQYIRRMQASGLMLLIGILIPLGDSLIPWRKAPALFAIYWLFVLALVAWVILLAVSDLVATRAHSHVALGRIQRQQRELEQEAARLRSTRNGGPSRTD
ncbi:MAG: hypothetical protein ACF8TS_10270 [Maioricimonas sp. JB049]